jgi:hypothetical protein
MYWLHCLCVRLFAWPKKSGFIDACSDAQSESKLIDGATCQCHVKMMRAIISDETEVSMPFYTFL